MLVASVLSAASCGSNGARRAALITTTEPPFKGAPSRLQNDVQRCLATSGLTVSSDPGRITVERASGSPVGGVQFLLSVAEARRFVAVTMGEHRRYGAVVVELSQQPKLDAVVLHCTGLRVRIDAPGQRA
jgi:hypothetical protein